MCGAGQYSAACVSGTPEYSPFGLWYGTLSSCPRLSMIHTYKSAFPVLSSSETSKSFGYHFQAQQRRPSTVRLSVHRHGPGVAGRGRWSERASPLTHSLS
ncbi:hypothetical protein BKA80DRAFT_59513 [Phyllosticta citrichinensis]